MTPEHAMNAATTATRGGLFADLLMLLVITLACVAPTGWLVLCAVFLVVLSALARGVGFWAASELELQADAAEAAALSLAFELTGHPAAAGGEGGARTTRRRRTPASRARRRRQSRRA